MVLLHCPCSLIAAARMLVIRVVVAPIDRSLLAVATGKRTVTQLAAMVLEYALIAPKLTGSYSTADFLEEMKGVFRTVVLKKRQVMLSS